MASGSHETPLQLRIITCHVGLKSFGVHLELEDLGFQSELEVFSNFWNCLVGRGCRVLFRVLCVPVQRHTVDQESKNLETIWLGRSASQIRLITWEVEKPTTS